MPAMELTVTYIGSIVTIPRVSGPSRHQRNMFVSQYVFPISID